MKYVAAILASAMIISPAFSQTNEDKETIRKEFSDSNIDDNDRFNLENIYGVYMLADYCKKENITNDEDLNNLKIIATEIENRINRKDLQDKLWSVTSKDMAKLFAKALDTNQSYGMCLDVKNSVKKMIVQHQPAAPKPF